jgi:hypothetical protein
MERILGDMRQAPHLFSAILKTISAFAHSVPEGKAKACFPKNFTSTDNVFKLMGPRIGHLEWCGI